MGNAKKLDAQDDSYETVIFSFNGLMMIQGEENRLQVMKEIKRVLKNK
ncbi:class I SAM-dependent methyltransferase [Patescibacteria group bacterium]|nr:class I SAM-dependent methyltransferase [Patescibacteria group bacterium]MBU1757857.1 class I SAM-dependent methyltransferase [Patescibacteria group bacterium]